MRQLSAACRTMSDQEKDRYRDVSAKQSSQGATGARRRSHSSGGGSSQRRSTSVSDIVDLWTRNPAVARKADRTP